MIVDGLIVLLETLHARLAALVARTERERKEEMPRKAEANSSAVKRKLRESEEEAIEQRRGELPWKEEGGGGGRACGRAVDGRADGAPVVNGAAAAAEKDDVAVSSAVSFIVALGTNTAAGGRCNAEVGLVRALCDPFL